MKPCISTLLFLVLFAYSTSAFAQTKWFKYEGNPVLDVGPPGSWDDAVATIDKVIIRDSVYQMWYIGRSMENPSAIGYGTSRDGLTWEKLPLNPVMRISPEAQWESSGLHRPYVVATGSSYKMWYNNADAPFGVHVGHASSPDGIVWTKYLGNPVLHKGPPGAWDSKYVGWVTVIGPDTLGSYKMWYEGVPAFKVGYATATDETSWTKLADPIFEDYAPVYYPRVINNEDLYEMWYSVEIQPSNIGYATSLDGVHWTKSSENPVLRPGPPGAWDETGLRTGDIHFDGRMYRMWYHGRAEEWRSGYAVSPKGIRVSVLPAFVSGGANDSAVQVAVKVNDPSDLYFSARIIAQAEQGVVTDSLSSPQIAVIDLFVDGAHDDGLINDGLFANTWVPSIENIYFVDLKMKLQGKQTLEFEMRNADAFTTIGPVSLEDMEVFGDNKPHPGDTILMKLTLRNQSVSSTARRVAASLIAADSSISNIPGFSVSYGDILPGEVATASGYHRLIINSDVSAKNEAQINVSISSSGVVLWYDTFTLHVLPPWWQTNWAYGLYLMLLVSGIFGVIRYAEMRKLKRKIKLLEQEQTLERERARISQDMHDEVGASLTEIAILGELALKKPEESRKHIQQMSERASEVIDNISEIVWSLNPKYDSLDNVIAHIRRFAVEYFKITPIDCCIEVPDLLPSTALSAEIRRNLFLVVKESIHNVVKHSQAREVTISVTTADSRLELQVYDNGRGFSIGERLGAGDGLINMKKRIEESGGTFNIESALNRGTKVSLVLNLNSRS